MPDETYQPIPDAAPPGPQTTVSMGGDSTSSGASREIPTPATTQAMGAAQLAGAQVPVAQAAVGDAAELQQNQIADQQGDAADQAWRNSIDAQANDQQMRDRIDAANRDKQTALDATKGLGYESMWAHASTGKKILEGLGALAGGMSGNVDAMKSINDNIKNQVEQDHQMQRANIDQKYEQARLRGEDVNQLYTQWEHENGVQAAKEQRAHEAIAAKALEVQTRAGIPLSKAQNNLLIKQQLADAASKNVEMNRAFDRKAQSTTTKQLSPSETVITGKPGKQVTPAERKEDAAVFSLTSDAAPVLAKPLTADEKKAAYAINKSMTPEKGGLEARAFDWAKDKIGGVNVDKIPPESRARIDAAMRIAQHAAKGQSPEAFAKAMETIIPDESDVSGTKKKALTNLLTTEGAGTVRPTYWANKLAEKTAAQVTPKTVPGTAVAPIGTTKVKNGVRYVKVAENNWQPG